MGLPVATINTRVKTPRQYHLGNHQGLPAARLCRPGLAPRSRNHAGGAVMLTVHHLNNSRSQRVLWLLEELGVPYEIARYQRQPDMRAPKELRAVHPLGKSPVITDNGNTVAESGAIVEYIVDTYGNGRLIPPPHTPARLRYTYWLHYAEGS